MDRIDFDLRDRDESGMVCHNKRVPGLLETYFIGANTDELTERYVKHLKLTCEAINARLDKLPNSCPRLRAVSALQTFDAAKPWVLKFNTIRNAMRGHGRQMYREGINTAFDLWEKVYIERRLHVVAYGGTNLGKTSCADFLRLLAGTLNFLCLDQHTCVLNILVPRHTLVSQARASLTALRDLYGMIIFENCDTGKRLSLDEAHQHLVSTVIGKDTIAPDALNLSRTKKEIEKRVLQAAQQKMALLTLIDEIHFGPLKGGRLGQKSKALIPGLMDELSISTKLTEEHLEMVREAARNVVAFSATPVTELQRPWVRVAMEYSSTYASAYLYFMGERISDHQVPVWGMTEFFEKSGVDLRNIIPSKLNSSKQPHPDTVKAAYHAVVKALRWFYQHGHQVAGAPDTWLGSFIRLHNNNLDSLVLAGFIEKHTDIKVVRYFRHKTNGDFDPNKIDVDDPSGDIDENIRDQCDTHISKGHKFCVLATAACRMADDLPKEVCFFIDFTKRSAFDVALRQGTAGRAGGHGKKSLVIMSDYNAHQIKADNERQGYPANSPSRHTRLDGEPLRRGRAERQVQIKIVVDRKTYLPAEVRSRVTLLNQHLQTMVKEKIGFLPTQYIKPVRDKLNVIVKPGYLIDGSRKVEAGARLFAFSRRTTAGLPALDVMFGPVLSSLQELAIVQNNVETVELLGFNGDEMPNYQTTEARTRVSFADQPYSLRDIEKLNEGSRSESAHGINSAKAWSKAGMIVQFVWSLRNGELEVGEIFWPAKMVKDKINKDVQVTPNDDVLQSAIQDVKK